MARSQDDIDALWAQIAALTERVYQLEQKGRMAPESGQQASAPFPAGSKLEPLPAHGISAPSPPVSILPPGPPAAQPQPGLQSAISKQDADIEKKIGQYWLNRIGIIAMLVGISYFLKYAFENNWIGPVGRIGIGVLAGIALVMWSELFSGRGYAAFSYSLKAIGIGTLYLSLWGAFQVYHLVPSAAAFIAMIIVTASTIALALSQDAELLATFALIGGFSTPILLSTGQNHEVVLFSYVCLLDLAILVMAVFKPWRRLLWGSFAGSIILFVGWYSRYYSYDQRAATVCFAALFAAIFAAIPLATRYERSTRIPGPSITLTVLPLFNAAAFSLALYAMYEEQKTTLTWYSLALAAVYLCISGAFKTRFPGQDTKFLNLLHVAIAIAFITIAIPLKLNGQWITIGWLVESAALLWISAKVKTDFLHYLAIVALIMGIVRLLFFDQFHTGTLIFNARFATYAVAIAVLGGLSILGRRHASETEMAFLDLAVVALNLLALTALTLEASDYFDRQIVSSGNYNAIHPQVSVARGFSYSAIWLIYGAGLMTVGFWKRSAFARWQSLILIAFTIGKVFFYDVSQLWGSYRIVSFIGLGAVLLGISFIYQRDWLKLSSRSSVKPTQKT
jgi:uncharacterized membrane protein